MSRFLDKLFLEYTGDSDRPWLNMQEFRYDSDVAKRIITVPPGFPTDLASTPRVPLIYEMFGNIAVREALVHDYLYTSGRESRAIADAVLREACESNGMSWWRRWGLWAGVRIGGSSHYTNPPA